MVTSFQLEWLRSKLLSTISGRQLACSCKDYGIDKGVSCPKPIEEPNYDIGKEEEINVEGDKDISHEVADVGVYNHNPINEVEHTSNSPNNSFVGESGFSLAFDKSVKTNKSGELVLDLDHSLNIHILDVNLQVIRDSFEVDPIISPWPSGKEINHIRCGCSFLDKSSHDAVLNMERRLRRLKRKISNNKIKIKIKSDQHKLVNMILI